MEVEDNILISLEPRHAENILAGLKRVELRRRTMNVSPGCTVWIYAKLPVGSIVGRTTLSRFTFGLRPSCGVDSAMYPESQNRNFLNISMRQPWGLPSS